MGLEGVELVMEVERRFGITIPDSEAGKLRTVGDLARLIDERMANKARSICPTMVGFLAVRRLIREVVDSPELRLRPSMLVAAAVPAHARRRFWRRTKWQMDIPLPPLELTQGGKLVLLTTSAILAAGVVSTTFVDLARLPLGAAVASLTLLVVYWALNWWRTEIPSSLATIGQLSQRVVALSVAIAPPLSPHEVFHRLRQIIVDLFGVPPDEIEMNTRFVEDLHFG